MEHHPRPAQKGGRREKSLALADLARLRQGAYRLFSQSLLYPAEKRVEAVAAVARELDSQDQGWSGFAFFPQWRRFLRSLKALDYQGLRNVQTEYIANFRVNRTGIPCPIYESAYLEDSFTIGWLLAQLEGEYAEVGLSPSPSLQEPPDHLAVELEFMAFLCSREAEAWETENLPRATEELQRQVSFLRRHLAWWFPKFASRVMALGQDSLFATIAQAGWAFVTHDTDLLDALLQRLEITKGVS